MKFLKLSPQTVLYIFDVRAIYGGHGHIGTLSNVRVRHVSEHVIVVGQCPRDLSWTRTY